MLYENGTIMRLNKTLLLGISVAILLLLSFSWYKQISILQERDVLLGQEVFDQQNPNGNGESYDSHLGGKTTLTYTGKQFKLNGQDITILSGAIHYFRLPSEYWQDRLVKMKACGLNTIETYVPWNLHEPTPGVFDFSGNLNLIKFLQLAQEIGFTVFLRPGPYICSEWEFGGLPSWLLDDPGMQVRSMYPGYIKAVDRYFDKLLPMVKPLQYHKNGPIVAFQLDNEFGSYSSNQDYLPYIKSKFEEHGLCELFFISDSISGLKKHSIPGVLKTVNFKTVENRFTQLQSMQPNAPIMVMEFWTGWFDWWGVAHHTVPLNNFRRELEIILSLGASVNFYMFFGGTNFGFMNGGWIDQGQYHSDITSYDYDAIIYENGQLSDKYFVVRELISKYYPGYVDKAILDTSSSVIRSVAYESILTEEFTSLWQAVETMDPLFSKTAIPMEFLLTSHKVVQSYGYLLYLTEIDNSSKQSSLIIRGLHNVHDRGILFINNQSKVFIDSNMKQQVVEVGVPGTEKVLIGVLAENGGRTNWEHFDDQRKGILSELTIEKHLITEWKMFPLDMRADYIRKVTENSLLWNNEIPDCHLSAPSFFKFIFDIMDTPCDTYLDMSKWGKGVAFINNKNIGRYWSIGPQQTLYLPAPFLTKGKNTIIIFEEQKCYSSLVFRSNSILNTLQ